MSEEPTTKKASLEEVFASALCIDRQIIKKEDKKDRIEFDSEAFYAQYVCAPQEHEGEFMILYALMCRDYDALSERCSDLNHFFSDNTLLIEHLYIEEKTGLEFVIQHHEISLLCLFFKPFLLLPETLEVRLKEELHQLIGESVNIHERDHKAVLSKILRKWDKINPAVQYRLLLIRLTLLDREDFVDFIPRWITNVTALQLDRLKL